MPRRASPVSRIVSLVLAVPTATTAVATAPSMAGVQATDAAVARRPAYEPAGSTMQEFIVKYRSGSRARLDADSLHRALREAEAGFAQAAGLRRVRRVSTGIDVIRADRPLDRSEALALMRRIASDPQVEYVIPNGKAEVASSSDQSRYSELWAFHDYHAGSNTGEAWNLGNRSGAVVALIDTSISAYGDRNASVVKTVAVNLWGKPLNGAWRWRGNEHCSDDTGWIDNWSIEF